MFRRKKKDTIPPMLDLDGKTLKEGDFVDCLRYDMGKCQLVKTEKGFLYESLDDGKRVSWVKMIDAATKNQKVRKLR
jgi:hypothetical protein